MSNIFKEKFDSIFENAKSLTVEEVKQLYDKGIYHPFTKEELDEIANDLNNK